MNSRVRQIAESLRDHSLQIHIDDQKTLLHNALESVKEHSEILGIFLDEASKRGLSVSPPAAPRFVWSDCAREYRCRDCGALTDNIGDHTCRVG